MNILMLDIETAPTTAHVWGLWDQNVGLTQIVKPGYTLCWAAKWYQDEEIMYSSLPLHGNKRMIKSVYKLLEQADAVVHYNGTKFDIPVLNKEFILQGLTPPAPYKQIDLLLTAKKQFRFPSNKLDFVANALGLGKKTRHIGHELWVGCMNNDPGSWLTMEEYNKQDVILLEKLYDRFKPWIRSAANYGLHNEGDTVVCPNCGGEHLNRRGYAYTGMRTYQRYVCKSCGNWFRSNKCESGKSARGVNA